MKDIVSKIEDILMESDNDITFSDIADELNMSVDMLDEIVDDAIETLKTVQRLDTDRDLYNDMTDFDELVDCSDGYADEGFGIVKQTEDTITLESGVVLHIQK